MTINWKPLKFEDGNESPTTKQAKYKGWYCYQYNQGNPPSALTP